MGRIKTFASWGKRLDERLLGPGGWLPHGTSYADYQKALARGSASPRWVTVARLLLILALFALMRWGGDSATSALLLIPIVAVFGVLTMRVDRDIRVAARTKAKNPE